MMLPNRKRLQLDITYECGMNCRNCNRFTDLAPGRPHERITLPQVETMLADSLAAGIEWELLDVLGGEPTRHPQLVELIGLLEEYRDEHNPTCNIRLNTHGAGGAALIAAAIVERYPSVEILNTNKSGPVNGHFAAAAIAPIDVFPEWESTHEYEGCPVAWNCGLGMNYTGFYCCAIAAAIDRIFQRRCSAVSLQALSYDMVWAQYQTFCPLCGHYRETLGANEKTWLSPAWTRAMESYCEAIQ